MVVGVRCFSFHCPGGDWLSSHLLLCNLDSARLPPAMANTTIIFEVKLEGGLGFHNLIYLCI